MNLIADELISDESSEYSLEVSFTANSILLEWIINEEEIDDETIDIEEDGYSEFNINAEIACIPDNVITRTWTATDDCGNSTSQDQVLTIVDTVAPEFTFIPADVTIECSDDVPADQCTAEDVCSDVTVTDSEEILQGDCSHSYTIVRTCVATDACGNSSSASWNIFVQDTTAPELEIADDVTIECDQDLPAAASEASDNCDNDLTVIVSMETIPG